jgi:hypothetical protein
MSQVPEKAVSSSSGNSSASVVLPVPHVPCNKMPVLPPKGNGSLRDSINSSVRLSVSLENKKSSKQLGVIPFINSPN